MTPGDPTLGRLEESLRPHRRTLSWPYLRQLRLGTCNFAAELWGREQLRTSWMSSGGHQPRGSFGRSGASAAGIAASWEWIMTDQIEASNRGIKYPHAAWHCFLAIK